VTIVLSLVLSATLASAQINEGVKQQLTLRGTVQAVDQTARTVTIRGTQGTVVTVDVPQTSVAFSQVQVGDVVSITYFDGVSVRPHAAGTPPIDRTDPPSATATGGALPGATLASSRVATVTITAWDPAQQTVSFTGPGGAAYTRRLADASEAKIMTGIKVGDRVDVTRTEAVRLNVESRTTVQATPDDTLRNRLTMSVLWGWDNQFSGNVIKESTGVTARGVPINMTETTYDEVYGRMDLLKIGLGYRISPRTEGVFNFVYSKSGSETAQVGTASAAAVPLFVDFEDYSYWGLEGGQRFFFTQVRFTPFVGYLVGLNRYGDIRGAFVNVPPEVTPGLAAQDGKFFEKSWALSLGPTGGFLVGLGPIEFMLEAQFRYMGGLSDVDWLVEEGLKDINDESSRWSIPVQIGARIRF